MNASYEWENISYSHATILHSKWTRSISFHSMHIRGYHLWNEDTLLPWKFASSNQCKSDCSHSVSTRMEGAPSHFLFSPSPCKFYRPFLFSTLMERIHFSRAKNHVQTHFILLLLLCIALSNYCHNFMNVKCANTFFLFWFLLLTFEMCVYAPLKSQGIESAETTNSNQTNWTEKHR